MLVKICGVSNRIDAFAAVEAGADAVGFVMGGRILPVEVEPHAQAVREIIKAFPGNVDSFLVTHLTDVDDIIALADYIMCTGIQISEDIGLDKLREIRRRTSKKIIKTVVVRDSNSLQRLREVEPYCDYVLLDTQVGGYIGGTGVTSDWNLCREMIKLALKPVYLAGGLTPGNLADAITATMPAGVDVSTGVSTYSDGYLKKDRKDFGKIKDFIAIARRGI